MELEKQARNKEYKIYVVYTDPGVVPSSWCTVLCTLNTSW